MNRIIETLSNGLRVVVESSDGNVAYIGALINAGSRDDGVGLDGLAHFVEHTLFKGTPSKKSWQVSNRMETIGGELNAYTTKEEILIYTNAPAGYEARAMELISDLAFNASFPEDEIDKERGVILEEINSYRDNAAYAVFDEFDELFYNKSQLAHNILGYTDSVQLLNGNNARDFLLRNFTPDNMVVYCMTPGDPHRQLTLLEKYFGKINRQGIRLQRNKPELCATFDETRDRNNHQANAVIGMPMFGLTDPRRYAMYLFSNILGGSSMNSALNRELRDRRGLVYTVESSISLYSDAGTFQVYFGSEQRNIEKCTRLIRREIEQLASSRLSDRTFNQAKRQLCGQLLVAGDNRESCAMSLAKGIMRHGEVHDNRHTAERIKLLTAEDVRSIAEYIATAPMSRLILL